jgi:hypothetical protein
MRMENFPEELTFRVMIWGHPEGQYSPGPFICNLAFLKLRYFSMLSIILK